jgi:hypothetical protein
MELMPAMKEKVEKASDKYSLDLFSPSENKPHLEQP